MRAYLFHYQFETIHPFLDGNGRVGRLLLAMMLHQWCGFTKPWLYMSAFFDKHKDEYIDRLYRVSATSEWDAWLGFCISGTTQQAKDTIRRCRALVDTRARFEAKVNHEGGSVRLRQIVDGLFQFPLVRPARLHKELGVTYPTADSDLKKLVALGILAPLPGASPKTFYAPEVFHIAFSEE